MDLRSVSNPAGTSSMDQLESANATSKLRGVTGFAGQARKASLGQAKIQPRFTEMLECFGDARLNPDAPQLRSNAILKGPDDARSRFSDSLEINPNHVKASHGETSELKEKFTEFVGQTLFGSMLASMRKTLGKPAYMHGGRTEEVFQQQLDQVIVEDLTEASADSIASPMFDLFKMQKRS